MEKMYSITEVAKLISVHRQTVYNWIVLEKKLKAQKVGKNWKVKESDLKKFIDKA